MDPAPMRFVWWGIALIVGGAVIYAFAPEWLLALYSPNTEQWNTLYTIVGGVLDFGRWVLPPLGAALLAGGLVMRYLDRRLGEQADEAPARWHWR